MRTNTLADVFECNADNSIALKKIHTTPNKSMREICSRSLPVNAWIASFIKCGNFDRKHDKTSGSISEVSFSLINLKYFIKSRIQMIKFTNLFIDFNRNHSHSNVIRINVSLPYVICHSFDISNLYDVDIYNVSVLKLTTLWSTCQRTGTYFTCSMWFLIWKYEWMDIMNEDAFEAKNEPLSCQDHLIILLYSSVNIKNGHLEN